MPDLAASLLLLAAPDTERDNERDQDFHFFLQGLRFVQKIFSTLNTILSPLGRFLTPSS